MVCQTKSPSDVDRDGMAAFNNFLPLRDRIAYRLLASIVYIDLLLCCASNSFYIKFLRNNVD